MDNQKIKRIIELAGMMTTCHAITERLGMQLADGLFNDKGAAWAQRAVANNTAQVRVALDVIGGILAAAQPRRAPRYDAVDNCDAGYGYELVDLLAIPPYTFAVGLREEQAIEITRRLNGVPAPVADPTTALAALERYKDGECVDDLAIVEEFLNNLKGGVLV